mgnify:CR=1 FL=1
MGLTYRIRVTGQHASWHVDIHARDSSLALAQAILDGRKTQTRRICKGARELSRAADWPVETCPYGQPGDRLWVREKWRIGAWNEDSGEFAIDYCDGPRREYLSDPSDEDCEKFNDMWIECCDELRAKGIDVDIDGKYRWKPGDSPLRWRPSIHMPRWASRITLEVTGVRVQRLADISQSDCRAEGCSESPDRHLTPRRQFMALWDSINAKRSPWASDPFCWVIEFQKVQP